MTDDDCPVCGSGDCHGHFYPQAAGWKAPGTSQEAAVTTNAHLLRARVLDRLCVAPGTADEVADALQLDRLSVRPRLSELRKLNQVVDTGVRHRNASGKRAIVWRKVVAPEWELS